MSSIKKEQVISIYNKIRKESPFVLSDNAFRDDIYSVAKEVCILKPEQGKLLDIGCGNLVRTALFSSLGFSCYGCDDYKDSWYRQGDNLKKICEFAKNYNITLHIHNDDNYSIAFPKESFDVVTIFSVIEHLHESPITLLNRAGEMLKPDGICVVTTPNSANFKKRVKSLSGLSIYPNIKEFYHSKGQWRGHVREYTLFELEYIMSSSGYKIIDSKTYHKMLHDVIQSRILRLVFRFITLVFPAFRDSLLVIGKKPDNWIPKQ